MPLHIRDPRAYDLARQLGAARGQTMTDAVIEALENELRRHKEANPLAARLDDIAARLAQAGAPSNGHAPSRDDIAALWGHD